jgi:hypothetical protein
MSQEIKNATPTISPMPSVMDELIIAHKRYFESSMANMVLENRSLTPAVDTVSKIILRHIEENQEKIHEIIKNCPKLTGDLYADHMFGRLPDKRLGGENPEKEILSQIVSVLSDETSPLKQVVHIHGAFIYRIYNKLLDEALNDHQNKFHNHALKKEMLHKKIYDIPSFKGERRIQKESPDLVKKKEKTGITTAHKFFIERMSPAENHRRGMDIFSPALQSTFFKMTQQHRLPFVAGASNHTGSLMLGAALYGDLNKEGLHEYALATFAYLTSGGNHSFHEVMIVANTLGIPFDPDSYTCSLPKNFLDTELFKKLQDKFDHFLPKVEKILPSEIPQAFL